MLLHSQYSKFTYLATKGLETMSVKGDLVYTETSQ
jgi:hypothetical protein